MKSLLFRSAGEKYFQKAPLNLIGMTYLGSVIILTPTDVLDLLKIILSQLLFYSDKKRKSFSVRFCTVLRPLKLIVTFAHYPLKKLNIVLIL